MVRMSKHAPMTEPDYPALVIDASGATVFVGVMGPDKDGGLGGQWLAQVDLQGAALEALFPSVDSALAEAGLSLDALKGFIYCEGPGSVLGLRLCAMAIETWSRLHPASAHRFAYNSLQLTAALITLDHPEAAEALLVSDWKKGAWNAVTIKHHHPGPTDVVDAEALASWSGPLFHLPQRKGWQAPPEGATTLAYEPQRLTEVMQCPGLLRPTEAIELYSSGVNTFQKWVPERHRAPTT